MHKIAELIKNNKNLEVLKETCSLEIYGENNHFYDKLKNFEVKKGNSSLEDDIYLGKIIYSYNKLIKLIPKEELSEFEQLKKAYERAKNIFIEINIPLVTKIANNYCNLGVEREDLIQEGLIKLIIAIDKYDYKKGFKFVTYATWWIKQGMSEALHNQARTIRKPTHVISIINKINEGKRYLSEKLLRTPTNEEISEYINIPVEDIEKYSVYSQDVVSFQSLNTNNDNDNNLSFENLLASDTDIEEDICNKTLKEALEEALEGLNEREQEVIRLRYRIGEEDSGAPKRTLDAVGKELGITRERVRQIEAKALRNLRHPSRSKYLKDYI